MKRLNPTTFDLPITEIRMGYRSAVYFNRTKQILENNELLKTRKALMQVFQKKNAVLCGMDEALAVLKLCTGHFKKGYDTEGLFNKFVRIKNKMRESLANRHNEYVNYVKEKLEIVQTLDSMWTDEFSNLEVKALFDGTDIKPWETVVTIDGSYSSFAHLESVYLGILARSTMVATNTRDVCMTANGKPILFFADRFDRYSTQSADGYAAKIGGADFVATDAMGEWWGNKGMGTMPHALIAIKHGDTLSAAVDFHKEFPETNLIVLVDFKNDCVKQSLECAEHFGDKLWGVRLDTSEKMVDYSIINNNQMGNIKATGVNPTLVDNVKNALIQKGHSNIKIVVSGGFSPEKITAFEKNNVPVDAYGVGSSLLKGSFDFTADIVKTEDLPSAKVGRTFNPNNNLELVK